MRIESAQIATSARHASVQQTVKNESLEYWIGERRPSAERAAPSTTADQLSLSPAAHAAQSADKPAEATHDVGNDAKLSPRDQLIANIVRRLFKALTGTDMQATAPADLADHMGEAQASASATAAQIQETQATSAAPKNGSTGFGLIYDRYDAYYESESLTFSAQGSIKTRDGQEIQFSVELNMNREFYVEHRDTIRLGDAKKIDPLVVNFDGNAAKLTDTKFLFDLNADGKSEQLSTLKPGSGLLALDKNGDSQINDGNELFGTQSGNGFADLAAYDEDHNGFIDEADSVFNKLRVWTPDSQGDQQLTGLADQGIGAIYLGSTATPYTYKNSVNATQASVAATGLFIRENGSSGTLQQIDYAI